jgi:hypothetical protein
MNEITLITAMIKIEKNKYNSDYIEWISNFLLNVDKNMIIFTTIEYYDIIKKLRSKYERKTFIIITTIEDLYMYKEHLDYLKEDHKRDIEKDYHNIELYMIWNEKLKFIEKGMDINPFKTTYFAWCDIGYIRNKKYIDMYAKNFPNMEKITEDKIYMLNIDYNFTEDDYIYPYDNKYETIASIIGGGFILGNEKRLRQMIQLYYNEIMPYYIKNKKFIGKDQTLYVSLYLKYPKLFKLIRGENDNTTIQYSQLKWFYFLKYLS